MPDMYDGLFGPDPMQIQRAQQQQLQQRGDQLAGMDPFARANSQIYSGAGGLMGGIAERMGAVNPQAQQAQNAQEIQKTIDHSTSKGLLEGAAKLQAVNPALAVKYVQAAQALKEKESMIGLRDAQARKALREPTGRGYEYEQMMAILDDPDASEEQKKMAQARIDALNTRSRSNGGIGGTPQLIADEQGNMWRVPKDGGAPTAMLKPDGTPLKKGELSPELKAQLAQAASGGKEVGKVAGLAQSKIPDVEAGLSIATRHVEELLAHPGFSQAVGMGLPAAKTVTGGKVKDFSSRFEQIKGEAFLNAFETLRGGGQITEVEGVKATAAKNRMDAATSEREFRAAAEDFLEQYKIGLEKLHKAGKLKYQLPTAAPTAAVPSGYAGGSQQTADVGRIQVLNQELRNPNLSPSDRAAVERELSRLGVAAPVSKDAAAIAWARANPQDPRAKEILKINGVR